MHSAKQLQDMLVEERDKARLNSLGMSLLLWSPWEDGMRTQLQLPFWNAQILLTYNARRANVKEEEEPEDKFFYKISFEIFLTLVTNIFLRWFTSPLTTSLVVWRGYSSTSR